MKILKYTQDQKSVWNELIANSRNGTFLFDRNFMEYHSDRFIDYSLMFYEENKLRAVMPMNISADNILHSHQGLSYGGLIYERDTKTKDALQMFAALKDHCIYNEISKLIYKRVPAIYHTYPSDEDLYALFVSNAKLTRRDVGCAIFITDPIKFAQSRRTLLNKSIKMNLEVKMSDDYDKFYILLEDTVARHNIKPVHSSQEMKLLASRFPENIKLVCCYKDGEVICGTWLFVAKNAIHTQYIANSLDGKSLGALEMIVDHIIKEYSEKKYLSFGISTENGGTYLNEGLSWQKESFGARAISHDFYELNF